MSQNRETLDAQMVLWVIILIFILFVAPAIYAAKAGVIPNVLLRGALLGLAKWQLVGFAYAFEEALAALGRMESVNPARLQQIAWAWEQMQGVLRYSGTWLRWPCALLLGVPCFYAFGRAVILHGKGGQTHTPLEYGYLACPQCRVLRVFASCGGQGQGAFVTRLLRQGLVAHRSFPRPVCPLRSRCQTAFCTMRKAMSSQWTTFYATALLTRMSSPMERRIWTKKVQKTCCKHSLEYSLRAVAHLHRTDKHWQAHLCAYAAGDKQVCMHILDALSSSYIETDGVASCPLAEDERFQKYIVATFQKHAPVLKDKLMQRYESFELVWFMALLLLLQRGPQEGRSCLLPIPFFAPSRPSALVRFEPMRRSGGMSRETFRPKSHMSHFAAEEKQGAPLKDAYVTQAVESLKEMLAQQGWFSDVPKELVSSGAEISGDVVFCPAESEVDDADYDAHNDENLTKELY